MKEIIRTARKYAVKNAYEHGGKAQAGAVVGKVKALFSDADLKKIAPLIAKEVKEVNALGKEKLKEEYNTYSAEGWELARVEKEKTLPELTWLKPSEKLITLRRKTNPAL